MRLLFCIKAMDNPGGGVERIVSDLACEFARRGHNVAVLSFDPPGGCSYYALPPPVERIRVDIGSPTSNATAMTTLRRIAALRVRVRAYCPDIVIGFMHSMFIPLGLALVGTSIPLIASEHIVAEHYRSRPLEALLLRLAPLLASSHHLRVGASVMLLPASFAEKDDCHGKSSDRAGRRTRGFIWFSPTAQSPAERWPTRILKRIMRPCFKRLPK